MIFKTKIRKARRGASRTDDAIRHSSRRSTEIKFYQIANLTSYKDTIFIFSGACWHVNADNIIGKTMKEYNYVVRVFSKKFAEKLYYILPGDKALPRVG